MKKYIFFILIIFLSSCTSRLDRKLTGIWSIDIDSLSTDNPLWYNFLDNMFILRNDHTASLPAILNLDINYTDGIKWETVNGEVSDSIYFHTQEHPMSGKFKITFYRDYKEKLFKMRLENDNTVIICRKGLQNFDKKIDW
ncbi:hypothetical protein [Dysgonomonas sp. GY617]|uniref:hypothetical protein n=1 Tax=Dysgonomonas sp. GY617 TaxID=2780420 RepID=UPI001883FF40|nr:hypothetical protein [Dysgonomonas sp. GY617]MBF0575567.1 hypothetical protein [Dysgonomonas sp. GY617]